MNIKVHDQQSKWDRVIMSQCEVIQQTGEAIVFILHYYVFLSTMSNTIEQKKKIKTPKNYIQND